MPRHRMGRRVKRSPVLSRAPTWRTFAAPRPTPKYAIHWSGRQYEVLTPELVAWKLDRWQLTHEL